MVSIRAIFDYLRQEAAMKPPKTQDERPRRRLLPPWTALMLPGALAGCHTGDHRSDGPRSTCPTAPKGSIPPPYGTHANAIFNGQAQRAEAEDFVIPKNVWYLGGNEPGPDGRRRLMSIAARYAAEPYPNVIAELEPEEFPDEPKQFAATSNEARRRRVVEFLVASGAADAETRVFVGRPTAEGLYGTTAAAIGNQYLQGEGGGGSNGNFSGNGSGGGSGVGGVGGVGGGFGGGVGSIGGLGATGGFN